MRWIRYIFAVIAIVCVICRIVSQNYYMGAGIPLQKPDSQAEVSIYQGHVTIDSWHGTITNLPRGWYTDMHYVDLDAARFSNEFWRDIGMDLPMPDDLPSFDYKPYRTYSDPAGKWTWSITSIAFPLWLPTLLFGLWPAIALNLHIKRRYFTHGTCRKCGYDLRGTPSGTCPECGHEQAVTKTV